MRHTTTTTTSPSSSSTAKNMGNGNKKSILTSLSADEIGKSSSTKQLNEKDVAKWSSADVQHWVKQQCKKFELKKATAEKFELNGQALVLLTKHDFIRRSPEAGEVLYYALQRLINPNKINSSRLDQNGLKNNNENHQHPRIVEVSNDHDSSNRNYPVVSSPTSYPIVEEPDDPPAIRRSQSESQADQNDERSSNFSPSHHIFAQHFHRPTLMNIGPGMAAAYFQQHHAVPPAFVFAQHPHVHFHHPTQFVSPQFLQHYHQLLTGQGILIEIMDENEMMMTNQPRLYLVTSNGQRLVMNENQVRQLLAEIQQRQQMQSAAAAAAAAHPQHRQ